MYRNTRPHGGFSRGNSSYQQQSRFGRGPARPARRRMKLDPRLFVQQAKVATPTAQYEVNNTFADFALHPGIARNIELKGYDKPTPIQDQTIPHILQGKDVIGIANTGTGKTAAFAIPALHMIAADKTKKVLIVAPTRELAQQIYDEMRTFGRGLGVYGALVIGGASLERQIHELRLGVNIVIGTPGRIKDLINQKAIDPATFQMFVLDEVDRMVDIGFIKDIEYLISLLPPVRQSLFFSATVTGDTKRILDRFVHDAVTVSVKVQETASSVKQDIVRIDDPTMKVTILDDILKRQEVEKAIVFGRTKHGIEKLAKALSTRGHRVEAIHGNKSQGQRQRALQNFKRNTVNILLATDVASRGIDVQDITHVINYDAPESYDDYVHRIGRTGRANKTGTAITFVE